MKYIKFGNTDLKISQVGFGAWAIGGPVMAGNIPIGWGDSDDETSKKALIKAYDLGINFYDTANFYGLGHSEDLIGETFKDNKDIVIATKVGHRLLNDGSIILDYTKKHILEECDKSLKRLKREQIDIYQLHSAKIDHLKNGECIEAMEILKEKGKIKYWGISLNTFDPFTEGEYLLENSNCSSFQVVLNMINQRAIPIIKKAASKGLGIIARMPLQFGLLTGKFDQNTRFSKNDHRSQRLRKEILEKLMEHLPYLLGYAKKYNVTPTHFALSFPLNIQGVSCIIPGIRTPQQAEENSIEPILISTEDIQELENYYKNNLDSIITYLKQIG